MFTCERTPLLHAWILLLGALHGQDGKLGILPNGAESSGQGFMVRSRGMHDLDALQIRSPFLLLSRVLIIRAVLYALRLGLQLC